MDTDLTFAPAFEGERSALLADAIKTIRGLDSELGPDGGSPDSTPVSVAVRLFDQLDRAVAEFDRTPEIYPLNEKYFTARGTAVPVSFKDLVKQYRLYWLRVPITLKPADDMPFVMLKCGVEFNPRGQADKGRPRALMIFPDKKFKTYMEASDSLEVNVGANAALEMAAGIPTIQTEQNKLGAKAGAQAKLGGHLALKIGPFRYTWKKAVVDHSPAGTGKVFWTLNGTEFLAEDGPNFVVVLQVPNDIETVEIAAVLRAYPRFDLTGNIKRVLQFFSPKTAGLLREGAPAEHSVLWDVTSTLDIA